MGAKASTEFGQIYINTDKPGYFQGEYISGMISLNLIKDFPGNEILFKIKGKEEARWAEGVGRNKIQHQGKKIILSHQFLLYRFNSLSIPKGQYRFPFSLFMAPSLPASFRNMWPTAIVSYKIKGEIKSKDKNFKVFRNSQVLRLKQAKNDAYAPLITNLKVAVDIFCCFDQGNTKIETKVNKTNFFEGETALIECSVDNSQCNLRLTTVEMSLVRKLTMKSDWDDSHTISFTYSSKINRLDLPAKTPSPSKINFELLMKNTDPNLTLPSTSLGEIVKNCYFLSLYPRYESVLCNCCTKRVETPVLIYDKKDESLKQVKAPENWNPQIMPVQNVDWRNSQMYQGKNSEGFKYPKINAGQMFQQYAPTPIPLQQQNYNYIAQEANFNNPKNNYNNQVKNNNEGGNLKDNKIANLNENNYQVINIQNNNNAKLHYKNQEIISKQNDSNQQTRNPQQYSLVKEIDESKQKTNQQTAGPLFSLVKEIDESKQKSNEQNVNPLYSSIKEIDESKKKYNQQTADPLYNLVNEIDESKQKSNEQNVNALYSSVKEIDESKI